MTGIWYIVGFGFAGVSFVFLTIGAAWLLTHRNRGDAHKGLPYESGIDTYGDTHGASGCRSTSTPCSSSRSTSRSSSSTSGRSSSASCSFAGFVTMLVFVGVLLLGLAYAWRKGVLSWK